MSARRERRGADEARSTWGGISTCAREMGGETDLRIWGDGGEHEGGGVHGLRAICGISNMGETVARDEGRETERGNLETLMTSCVPAESTGLPSRSVHSQRNQRPSSVHELRT